MYALCSTLAGQLVKWSTSSDRDLEWVMGYLKKTKSYRLKWKLCYADLFKLTLELHTDGSHAGCVDSRRGHSGFNVFLKGM